MAHGVFGYQLVNYPYPYHQITLFLDFWKCYIVVCNAISVFDNIIVAMSGTFIKNQYDVLYSYMIMHFLKLFYRFLRDQGVKPEDLGRWLTINPLIFREKIEDLDARINYLKAVKFTSDEIVRLISRNPHWLLFRYETVVMLLYQQGGFSEARVEGNFQLKKPRKIGVNVSHSGEYIDEQFFIQLISVIRVSHSCDIAVVFGFIGIIANMQVI